jgi:hypothetical protein
MTRPQYERDSDLAAEAEVIAAIEDRWSCRAIKLPKSYRLDFALTKGEQVRAWAEIKCRGRRYPTYMLSLHKALAGLEMARATGCPFLLVVRYPDGIVYARMQEEMAQSCGIGGRKDRGDWQDIEPVVHIPMDHFRGLDAR